MSLVTVQRNKQQQQSHDRIGRYAAANIGHAKPRPKNQLQDLGTYRRPLFAAGMIVLLVREQTNGKIKANQPRTLAPARGKGDCYVEGENHYFFCRPHREIRADPERRSWRHASCWEKQVLYLGSLGKKPSFYPPRFLRATGVEDIKRWIGTPDWVFKKKPEIAERHKLQKALSENLIASFDELFRKHSKETDPAQKKKYSDDIGGLFHKNRKEVRAVAKSYIYGNSASYANWRPLLDWHLRDFNFPIWLFGTVVVENGAVLELDEGYNILAGDTLVIEQGGTIRSGWAFNVDFRNLGRTL